MRLFDHDILQFTFSRKCYHEDYGLDTSRSMLAVPFRAKDIPAPKAEFGHPDISLLLTCLTYYYSGLTDAQIDASFEALYRLDNADVLYEYWIEGLELPESMRQLRGLNLDDGEKRIKHIYPALRYNKETIDFYLREFVFPKEAKAFAS